MTKRIRNMTTAVVGISKPYRRARRAEAQRARRGARASVWRAFRRLRRDRRPRHARGDPCRHWQVDRLHRRALRAQDYERYLIAASGTGPPTRRVYEQASSAIVRARKPAA